MKPVAVKALAVIKRCLPIKMVVSLCHFLRDVVGRLSTSKFWVEVATSVCKNLVSAVLSTIGGIFREQGTQLAGEHIKHPTPPTGPVSTPVPAPSPTPAQATPKPPQAPIESLFSSPSKPAATASPTYTARPAPVTYSNQVKPVSPVTSRPAMAVPWEDDDDKKDIHDRLL